MLLLSVEFCFAVWYVKVHLYLTIYLSMCIIVDDVTFVYSVLGEIACVFTFKSLKHLN